MAVARSHTILLPLRWFLGFVLTKRNKHMNCMLGCFLLILTTPFATYCGRFSSVAVLVVILLFAAVLTKCSVAVLVAKRFVAVLGVVILECGRFDQDPAERRGMQSGCLISICICVLRVWLIIVYVNHWGRNREWVNESIHGRMNGWTGGWIVLIGGGRLTEIDEWLGRQVLFAKGHFVVMTLL